LITNRHEAALMTDIIDIDRFHIGKINTRTEAAMMGIPINSGYIQFVPAGIRTVLTYPVPLQTSHDFYMALKGKRFRTLAAEHGEKKIFDEIRKDAVTNGSPVNVVFKKLAMGRRPEGEDDLSYTYITGVYDDGLPYNGIIAKAALHLKEGQWAFNVITNSSHPVPVTGFVKDFESNTGQKARIAWNGGYILNPELVGKLGLPENYIGSPLGLIIADGAIISPPLFNKPALLFYDNGAIDIRRVNCAKGLTLTLGGQTFDIPSELRNPEIPGGDVCFYDLMMDGNTIPDDNDRVTVRLSGNRIMEVLPAGKNQGIQVIPVGLTLSFIKDVFPAGVQVGDGVSFGIDDLKGCLQAVEAGPLLVDNGNIVVDMVKEGWAGEHSIRTQAARLDYTDLRGPKIAAGFDASGDLLVLAVNGRIRESVGATHHDIAGIMQKSGAVKAMGFDPGGSSTLVLDGVAMNISPYNRHYEKNTFTLPPEPRAVSNAIIGYLRNV
ncbi:MAG TPA: phosphodiester glycosidase family protein, partial [Bacteroidales bacterium]|nr:phosphodiester glycosidase family protein [Bacteroidales bacterium]